MWISAGAFILIALIVCIGISIYVGNSMTHPEKKPIDQFPSDYGMDYEDIEFVSRDGETNLSGWVIEPETDAKMTLIFGHGYKGNRFKTIYHFSQWQKIYWMKIIVSLCLIFAMWEIRVAICLRSELKNSWTCLVPSTGQLSITMTQSGC